MLTLVCTPFPVPVDLIYDMKAGGRVSRGVLAFDIKFAITPSIRFAEFVIAKKFVSVNLLAPSKHA